MYTCVSVCVLFSSWSWYCRQLGQRKNRERQRAKTSYHHITDELGKISDLTTMAFVHAGPFANVNRTKRSDFLGCTAQACPLTLVRGTLRRGLQTTNAIPNRQTVKSAAGSTDDSVKSRKRDGSVIEGRVFVVGDNIDTDQIIPAEYLTLVPSDPVEYAKLGSYAMSGLPFDKYNQRFVNDDEMKTEYRIIIAGDNFGCGSSREHAPVAIGAAGGVAIIAQSYARIFFRNCSATGELYPWESNTRLIDHFKTDHVAHIDVDKLVVTNVSTGKSFPLKSLGDVLPVIDAGGIFEYARKTGMISKKASV